MRDYVFYTILTVFFNYSVSGQCRKELVDYILWQKDKRLNYEDFQSVQDTTFLVYGYPANGAAMTKIETTFMIDVNNNLTFSVVNKFLKKKSWIKNQKPLVLAHEQGHFDISEIYARKIRKKLKELLEKDIVEETILSQAVNALLSELETYQQRYDEETHHGFVLEKQKIWEGNIRKELEQLQKFE